MQNKARLHIVFSGYWSCSTGRGHGASLDSIVARDHIGLPIVPGRTIKGILRDAYERVFGFEMADILFGSSGFTLENDEPRAIEDTFAGALTFSNGTINPEVRNWISSANNGTSEEQAKAQKLTETLFVNLSRTAINDQGAAKNKSLRVIEAVVPLHITATISLLNATSETSQDETALGDWIANLNDACATIDGVGSNRSRGLGRCHVSLEEA